MRVSARVRAPCRVPNLLSEELLKLATCLDAIADRQEEEEEKIELTAASGRCLALAAGVKEWLGQELPDQVYWVEVRQGRIPRVALASGRRSHARSGDRYPVRHRTRRLSS